MISSAYDNQEVRRQALAQSRLKTEHGPAIRLSVLVATTDPEIRQSMAELLQAYPLHALWASGMEEIKAALTREDVAACFCGFWLVDGTYRDVVRHLKQQRTETPVIIVCAPTCPNEYRGYLAALNIRALDFICHPYRRSDLEPILDSAIALRHQPAHMPRSMIDSSGGSLGFSELRRAS